MSASSPPSLARISGYGMAILAALLAIGFASLTPRIAGGQVMFWSLDWAPSLGVSLAFMLDGLALIFALLITGIGALIFLYAVGYLGDHPQFGRFVLFLAGFMAAMLGLVLARDLITIFVFWELTAVLSWLLIGFDSANPRARRNALQALLITGAGGLALLAGLVMIGQAAGSYDLGQILQGGGLQDHHLYGSILVLILAGAFTKSAQFPFHVWLPNAMAAPTPVSAYLHSATMVKAGVYLLARLHPVLGGTLAWQGALVTAGAATMVLGAVMALRQSDLKLALAYTTLMALGVITLFLGGSSPYALTAAMVFLITHALYKAALFMVVGAVDHATGTRDARQLSGLRRAMPVVAVSAALAAASMAGLPPLVGWIGKELLYAGALDLTPAIPVVLALIGSNALVFAVAGKVGWSPFAGPPRSAHPLPWQMLIGPALLSLAGLVAGLFAAPLIGPLLGQTVTGSLGASHAAGLHLWAGANLPLALGLATLALGAVIFRFHRPVQTKGARYADRFWDGLLDGFRQFSTWLTARIQTRNLVDYLLASFGALTILIIAALVLGGPRITLSLGAPLFLYPIAALIAAGALLAVTTGSRIAAISGVGTVGIGVALIFVSFGAPDVAITQLMVETLSAVLLGIALLKLPALSDRRPRATRRLHMVLAGLSGLVFALVILTVTSGPIDRRLTAYFEQNAHLIAHGRNIVNVILVDFRAFDTFGEISVVLLAAIGAHALLRQRSRR